MSDPLRFVLNRHHATTLHFDLRLEVDGDARVVGGAEGALAGPGAKRLAVQVEDHGMEHLDYEGRDEDGGRVQTKIVWDTGLYEPAEPTRARRSTRGHLRFVGGRARRSAARSR